MMTLIAAVKYVCEEVGGEGKGECVCGGDCMGVGVIVCLCGCDCVGEGVCGW